MREFYIRVPVTYVEPTRPQSHEQTEHRFFTVADDLSDFSVKASAALDEIASKGYLVDRHAAVAVEATYHPTCSIDIPPSNEDRHDEVDEAVVSPMKPRMIFQAIDDLPWYAKAFIAGAIVALGLYLGWLVG